MKKLSSAIFILAVVMLVSVLASLMPSDHWFIRTIDLVREPMSYLAAILLLIVIFVKSKTRWPATVILGLVIAINVWRIWPYSALAGTQVQLIERGAAGAEKRCYSALSANVKVKNENYGLLADQVRRYNPDILFLMETDAQWIEELEPLISTYSHVARHPQPEAFGMVFATRLPVLKSNIVENTYRDTPTLYATLHPPVLLQ